MMGRTSRTRPRRLSWSLMMALVLIVAACSSSNDDEASTESEAPSSAAEFEDGAEAMEEVEGDIVSADAMSDGDTGTDDAFAQDQPDAEAAEDDAGSGGVGSDGVAAPVDTGREIIFTAFVNAEVEDVAAASQRASTAIQGLGGLLFGQTTTIEGTARSTLTFKVPPAEFQNALAKLGDIGVLREQVITADDVTERVVDLQSQIITSELSVERLRGFLEGATNLNDIADLERQLLERETNLERLRGQLRTVQNQVSLATITVTFTQKQPGPELTIEQTMYFGHDAGATCPGFDELSIDEGQDLTVCYVITNTGDTFLGDVEIVDHRLGLDITDLEVISGTLDEPLPVGGRIALYGEAEPTLRSNAPVQVSAMPVSADGTDLRLPRVGAQDSVDLEIIADTSLPGFRDGLSAAWGLIVVALEVIEVTLGFLLPFIWVIPLLWVLDKWRKQRRAAKMPPPPTHRPTEDDPPTD